MQRSLAAALLGAVLVTTPAAAQQVPTLQAGAGGRYETQIDPKDSLRNFSGSQVAAFRSRVDRLVALFSAMPEVTAPSSPICHRLESWIEIEQPHGALSAAVSMMYPISFENGRCHRMTRTGIFARINGLSQFLDPQEAVVRVDEGPSDWFLLPRESAAAPVIRIGNSVAFTHKRAPLLTPVSAERYLRERVRQLPAEPEGGDAGELARWLAEGKPRMLAEGRESLREMAAYLAPEDLAKMEEALRVVVESTEDSLRRSATTAGARGPSERQELEALLASLDPAARAAPACLTPGTGTLDPSPACPAGMILVELNPDYFDQSRPEAVQLLVLDTPVGRTHGENDQALAERMSIWAALDHAAFARLVE